MPAREEFWHRLVVVTAVGCAAACQRTGPQHTIPRSALDEPAPPAPALALSDVLVRSVGAIDVIGLHRLNESRVRAAISTRPGRTIDRDVIRRDLRAIHLIGGVLDVAVDAGLRGDQVVLRYVVTEARDVASVVVAGNERLPDAELIAETGLAVGDVFDPVAAQRGALAITGRYHRAGHYRARVSWQPADEGTGTAILYSIAEGPRVTIARVEFPGARVVSPARLAQLLADPGDGTVAANAAGGPFVPEGIAAAEARMLSLYYDRGYADARIGRSRIRVDGQTLVVSLPVSEGHRYRFGPIRITGELAGSERSYRKAVSIRPGQVFSRSRLGTAARDVETLHATRTRAPSRVEVTSRVLPGHRLAVDIEVGAR